MQMGDRSYARSICIRMHCSYGCSAGPILVTNVPSMTKKVGWDCQAMYLETMVGHLTKKTLVA